jgi:20S proteasome alpha/beta subunit
MSLCIAVVIPEGIVVAGESRQTQIIAGVNRVASDNAVKVFELTDTIIAATAGWAFLQPQGTTLQKNISAVIEDFKETIPVGSSVLEIATLLWQYFNNAYQAHIAALPGSAVAGGIIALNFMVGGYDSGSSEGTLYSLEIPSTVAPTTPARSTSIPSPWWIGQIEVLSRILKEY